MSSTLSDGDLCKLMVDTHGARFDGSIWTAFDDEVVPLFSNTGRIADLGCGPGLFLFDLYQRLPEFELQGFDASQTMLDFAENIDWQDKSPEFQLCDLTAKIPAADHSLDLITMNFFLHNLDYPFSLLAEAQRVLKKGGLLWVYDWARRPLKDYLQFWEVDPGLPGTNSDVSLPYRLFPKHNRYTQQDWQFVFEKSGFVIHRTLERAQGQHLLMIVKQMT